MERNTTQLLNEIAQFHFELHKLQQLLKLTISEDQLQNHEVVHKWSMEEHLNYVEIELKTLRNKI